MKLIKLYRSCLKNPVLVLSSPRRQNSRESGNPAIKPENSNTIGIIFIGLFFASGSLYGNQVFEKPVFQVEDFSFRQRAAIQSVWPQFFLNNPSCRVSGSMEIKLEEQKGYLKGGDFYSIREEAGFFLGLSPEQITVLKDIYGINPLDIGHLRTAHEVHSLEKAISAKDFHQGQVDGEIVVFPDGYEITKRNVEGIEWGKGMDPSFKVERESRGLNEIKMKMFWTAYRGIPSDIEKMAEEYGIQVYSKDFKVMGDINLAENILYGMDGRGELFVGEIGDRDGAQFKQGSEENLDEIVGVRLFEIAGDIKDLEWQKVVSFESLRSEDIGEEIGAKSPYDSYPELSQGSYFYVMEPIGGGGGGGGSFLRAVIRAAFEGPFNSGKNLRIGRIQKIAVPFSSHIQSEPSVALPVIQCDGPLSLKINVLQ